MKQHHRVISLMLCLAMAVSIALSAAFIIISADHECTGDDCEICYHIHICEQTLKKLTLGAAVLAGTIAMQIVSVLIPVFCCDVRSCDTLISMKVKLSC